MTSVSPIMSMNKTLPRTKFDTACLKYNKPFTINYHLTAIYHYIASATYVICMEVLMDKDKKSGTFFESLASGATFGVSEVATGGIKTDTVEGKLGYGAGLAASLLVPGAMFGRVAQGMRLGYSALRAMTPKLAAGISKLKTAAHDLPELAHLRGVSGRLKPESPSEARTITAAITKVRAAGAEEIGEAIGTAVVNASAGAGSHMINKRVTRGPSP